MKVGAIEIPADFRTLLPFFVARGPTMGGISGGRTSALMHVLALAANADDKYIGVFANTGKEHAQTLVFLDALGRATARPLRWVEFRPPQHLGEGAKNARFAAVDFATASRDGTPFVAFLETLAAFRRVHKNLGPITPGPNMRVCTAYMKVRTMYKFSVEHFGREHDKFIGLCADEPHRVGRIRGQDTAAVTHRTPLSDAGITHADVLDFWRHAPFDLEIPEYLGNCNKCFLKDEADIARSFYEEPEDGQWWLDLQDRFGDFRKGKTPMRVVFAEAAVRMEHIVAPLSRGQEPECPSGFDPYRWKLLLRQEKRRAKHGAPAFSCACESAQLLGTSEDTPTLEE